MSKRGSEIENCESSETKIIKSRPKAEISSLPNEMIEEIILKLDKVEDLRNCMMLSNRFRHIILKSPRIMNNLLIRYPEEEVTRSFLQFLDNFGTTIKNIELIEGNELTILGKTPNLEDLSWSSINFNLVEFLSANYVELPKLKFLHIVGSVNYLISCIKDSNKLNSLMILSDTKDSGTLTNFIGQQKTLKDLKLICTDFDSPDFFLTQDISHDCQFKLDKFLYDCEFYNQNLINFLESQLKSLTDLHINSNLAFDVLDAIFRHGKNLNNLTLNCKQTNFDSLLLSPNFPEWMLPNVKFFSTNKPSFPDIRQIFRYFPNVESLKFKTIPILNETFPKLQTLHLGYLDCKNQKNLKLPNLKTLIFHNVKNLEFSEQFSQNVPNLENIGFNPENEENLDFLKQFKKLKKLELRIERMNFFRILIDYTKNVIYRDRDGLKNLGFIEKNFPGFEVIENKTAMKNTLFLPNFVPTMETF